MKTSKKKLPAKQLKNNPQEKLPFTKHLGELRGRLIWWVIIFVAGSILGYLNYEPILNWLIAPLQKPLYYTSPIGGFEAVFGVSVFLGFIISLPVLVYQTIKFIEPAVSSFKSKKVFIYLFASLCLALTGVAVAYYLILPASLGFLGKFGSDQLQSLISTRDYFSFVMKYLLGFAILFQLPLVIYIINWFVPISPKMLLAHFRMVLVVSFVIAAILTPTPDFINQTIMAIPLILLYLVTILTLWVRSFIVR